MAVGNENLLCIRGLSTDQAEEFSPAPLGEWGDVYWPIPRPKPLQNGFRKPRSVVPLLPLSAPRPRREASWGKGYRQMMLTPSPATTSTPSSRGLLSDSTNKRKREAVSSSKMYVKKKRGATISITNSHGKKIDRHYPKGTKLIHTKLE